mmetsp:Transcript_108889/g.339336  ORF Transcript_108889/g.339336 Transcript_108889/m.339336 type:complete len:149 (-) Transcript_108889:111-557(-)
MAAASSSDAAAAALGDSKRTAPNIAPGPEPRNAKKRKASKRLVLEVTAAGSARVNGRYHRVDEDVFDAAAYRNEHGVALQMYVLPKVFAPYWYFTTNYGRVCSHENDYYRAACSGDCPDLPDPHSAFEVLAGGVLPVPHIVASEDPTD